MPRVLVTPTMLRNVPGEYRDVLESAGLEVVYPAADQDTMQPETLQKCLHGIDAMLASTESITPAIIENSQLRVIARMGVGYDAVDVPAATRHNIPVTITPGILEDSVAEHTMALMLAVSRGIVLRDQEVRSGRWSRVALPRLTGKTFGLIGLGRIGRVVAQRAQGLGLVTKAFDPYATKEMAAECGVTLCSFEELLTTADVVSLHAVASPETADLMNAHAFNLMKPGAIFINASRGALVDEEALATTLRSGKLLGAALDTFKQEPPSPEHPLLSFPNVVVCTHMGGLDKVSEAGMSRLAAQCIVDLHQGRWPESCVINRELAANWKW